MAETTPVERSRAWTPLILLVLAVSCAPQAQRAASDAGAGSSAPASSPKRVTAAIMSEPQVLSWKLSAGDNLRAGLDTVEPLISVGLTAPDNQGQLRPMLAEAVPTVDNGLWKLFPDGTMETSWKIRQGAVWHDGT